MTNKKVAETYMEGFNATNHAKILSCLTDDMVCSSPKLVSEKSTDDFTTVMIVMSSNISA
jgi:hypothetical protein